MGWETLYIFISEQWGQSVTQNCGIKGEETTVCKHRERALIWGDAASRRRMNTMKIWGSPQGTWAGLWDLCFGFKLILILQALKKAQLSHHCSPWSCRWLSCAEKNLPVFPFWRERKKPKNLFETTRPISVGEATFPFPVTAWSLGEKKKKSSFCFYPPV